MTYNVLMGTLNPTHSLTHSPGWVWLIDVLWPFSTDGLDRATGV